MRHAIVLNAISAITFVLAVFFLVTRGLNLSVEFTGGTVMEVAYEQPADLEAVRKVIEGLGYAEVPVQNFGTSRDVLMRLPAREGQSSGQQSEAVLAALKAQNPAVDAAPHRVRGPAGGAGAGGGRPDGAGPGDRGHHDLPLAIRFEWKYAVSAIIANLHDVVIILGFFAFFQWEFSLAVLAAVLAVLGYSVNESVVIFDRIRETFRRQRKMTTVQIIDRAITSTISRTIITHGSTQIMVLSMLLFGGPTLHYFALALTIGILFGIYSSVFVAAAVAMWLGIKRDDQGPPSPPPAIPTTRTAARWSDIKRGAESVLSFVSY
jgi:preprotein translocase subunit SecF